MNLKDIGLFKLIGEKMKWHNQRQEVLAQNLANSDTPHYKARDLVPFDFKQELRKAAKLGVEVTNPAHLVGNTAGQGAFRDSENRSPYETAPTGNGVVLEEQVLKVGQNNLEYGTITSLYRKQMGLLHTALSGRN